MRRPELVKCGESRLRRPYALFAQNGDEEIPELRLPGLILREAYLSPATTCTTAQFRLSCTRNSGDERNFQQSLT